MLLQECSSGAAGRVGEEHGARHRRKPSQRQCVADVQPHTGTPIGRGSDSVGGHHRPLSFRPLADHFQIYRFQFLAG